MPRAKPPRPRPAASAPADPPAGVPGVSRNTPGVTGRRKRNRAKNPKTLRNVQERTMAGARIRRDVRRCVDQELADPAVLGGGKTNYSLLVEALLVRWLEDVGYPLDPG